MRITKKDQKYIKDNVENLSPEVIATNLNKPILLVKNWISQNIDLELDRTTAMICESLKRKPEWKEIEKQLVKEEKESFLFKWARIIKQFGQEAALPSEEMQLLLLLKYDILIDRNMVEQRTVMEALLQLRSAFEKMGGKYVKHDMSPDELDKISQLEGSIVQYQVQQQALNSELKDLTANHEKMMKGLKVTREQRISKIANSNHSFLDVVKELNDKQVQERQGKMLGKARAAMDKEAKILGNLHTYEANGEVDRPLLNCDTVDQEENITNVPE